MALSFAFGGNSGQSYDELQRRRAFAESLMAQGMSGQPKTAFEGINLGANKILSALMLKKLGAEEAAGRKAYEDQRTSALGTLFGNKVSGQTSAPVVESGPYADLGDDTIAALVKTGLEKRGLPSHVADAFVVNFKDESGLNPAINEASPMVPGSRGGYGLAQWTGPRREALEAFAASQGKPAGDMNVQLDFLMRELQGPEAAAGRNIMAAPDTATAATAIVNDFLRPAETHRDARASRYADIPTLLSLSGSPYANGADQSVFSALIGQALAPPEQPEPVKHETVTGPDGTVYSFNPVTNAMMPLTGAKPANADVPSAFAALDLQAKAAGYEPGTPEYQDFMANGGGSGAPAAFIALDLQAKAAGFQPGSPEYREFMATRGAGFIAEAKAKGEDKALLASTSSKMEGLEQVVAELETLADKATYTKAGQTYDYLRAQSGAEPRDAAVARSEYIAKVDNQVLPMLRDTFGAAFTVKEGETLRATLGDPNKTPQEKKAVLRAFIEQKKRDVSALEKRTGMTATPEDDGLTPEERAYLGLE